MEIVAGHGFEDAVFVGFVAIFPVDLPKHMGGQSRVVGLLVQVGGGEHCPGGGGGVGVDLRDFQQLGGIRVAAGRRHGGDGLFCDGIVSLGMPADQFRDLRFGLDRRLNIAVRFAGGISLGNHFGAEFGLE